MGWGVLDMVQPPLPGSGKLSRPHRRPSRALVQLIRNSRHQVLRRYLLLQIEETRGARVMLERYRFNSTNVQHSRTPIAQLMIGSRIQRCNYCLAGISNFNRARLVRHLGRWGSGAAERTIKALADARPAHLSSAASLSLPA